MRFAYWGMGAALIIPTLLWMTYEIQKSKIQSFCRTIQPPQSLVQVRIRAQDAGLRPVFHTSLMMDVRAPLSTRGQSCRVYFEENRLVRYRILQET